MIKPMQPQNIKEKVSEDADRQNFNIKLLMEHELEK
jgi:hypothetical protein